MISLGFNTIANETANYYYIFHDGSEPFYAVVHKSIIEKSAITFNTSNGGGAPMKSKEIGYSVRQQLMRRGKGNCKQFNFETSENAIETITGKKFNALSAFIDARPFHNDQPTNNK